MSLEERVARLEKIIAGAMKAKDLKKHLEAIPDDALVGYMYFADDESISLVFALGPTLMSIPNIPLYPGLPVVA